MKTANVTKWQGKKKKPAANPQSEGYATVHYTILHFQKWGWMKSSFLSSTAIHWVYLYFFSSLSPFPFTLSTDSDDAKFPGSLNDGKKASHTEPKGPLAPERQPRTDVASVSKWQWEFKSRWSEVTRDGQSHDGGIRSSELSVLGSPTPWSSGPPPAPGSSGTPTSPVDLQDLQHPHGPPEPPLPPGPQDLHQPVVLRTAQSHGPQDLHQPIVLRTSTTPWSQDPHPAPWSSGPPNPMILRTSTSPIPWS